MFVFGKRFRELEERLDLVSNRTRVKIGTYETGAPLVDRLTAIRKANTNDVLAALLNHFGLKVVTIHEHIELREDKKEQ